MIAPRDERRLAVLVDLIELRVTPGEAVAAVKQLPWDSDVELVLLSRTDVLALLTRYLRRGLSPADLEAWADAIESREDIGAEPEDEELLRAFVFQTANPALAGPISDEYVRRWLVRIGGDDQPAIPTLHRDEPT